VSAADGLVSVEVADDGVGGASLDDGSGIQGLVDRVGALSGTLAVDSPPGEGTRVMASIPLDGAAAAEIQAGAAEGVRVLPADEAHALQAERKRHLLLRTASLGIVAGVLVVIWALTGPDLPWIVWPLLGIGLIAGLDAWRVYATPPLSDADLASADGPAGREAALRAVRKRRGLRHQTGALVILNLFLVGVWLASGSSYFWPAWVMLGSAAALAIKALPRPSRAHAHLLGDHP
jgi:hypothetical protein